MNRIKNKVREGFSIIPNDLINDDSIDPVAFRIFCYMASKPDDWTFRNKDLMKVAKVKDQRTFRKYMDQLLNPGWLTRERTRGEGAKFDSYEYEINGEPVYKNWTLEEQEPVCNFSTVEILHSAKNAHLTNKDLEQINTNNKEREKRARFQPPTKEEVYSYMLEKTESEIIARREAEKMHDHFQSNGWKVGGKTKMQDWKAASRNWLRRVRDFEKPSASITNRLKVERGEEFTRKAEQAAAAVGIKMSVI